jgi:hypothetical protein
VGPPHAFYKAALSFLAYTPVETLSDEEKCVAAVLSLFVLHACCIRRRSADEEKCVFCVACCCIGKGSAMLLVSFLSAFTYLHLRAGNAVC